MAARVEKLKSTKRFGARYGPRSKVMFDKIERIQRSWQKCPYCNYSNVKRKSVGIWHCTKCDTTFTGKAYSVREEIKLQTEEESETKTEAQ